MKKRLLFGIIATAMAAMLLIGCGKTSKKEEKTTKEQEAYTTAEDGSYFETFIDKKGKKKVYLVKKLDNNETEVYCVEKETNKAGKVVNTYYVPVEDTKDITDSSKNPSKGNVNPLSNKGEKKTTQSKEKTTKNNNEKATTKKTEKTTTKKEVEKETTKKKETPTTIKNESGDGLSGAQAKPVKNNDGWAEAY